MKRLILTAVDNNDYFWYTNLVPFLLSLRQTDYNGATGVIAYGLSEAKQAVLRQNGCLVFSAPYHYDSIYIDRQWAAADIAEQGGFDQVALYDTDIWFPQAYLDVFGQIRHDDLLYCCLEPSFADFILGCVLPEARERVAERVHRQLAQHGRPWQVGLLLASRQGWQHYRHYLEDTLDGSNGFLIRYGIDTTAVHLYAADSGRVAVLPEYYNCHPACGITVGNVDARGNVLPQPQITLHGEAVQGLHITGRFRDNGRNYYEYAAWHPDRYYNAGAAYRPQPYPFRTADPAVLTAAFAAGEDKDRALQAERLKTENGLSVSRQGRQFRIEAAGGFQLHLRNPHPHPVRLRVAVEAVTGHTACHGTFVCYPGQAHNPQIKYGRWYDCILPPQAEWFGCSYDLDAENSRARWVFEDLVLQAV